VQVQISGCTSYCQGVTQVQQAVQSNSTLQIAGDAVAQASRLIPQPAPDGTPQATHTVTQIQLGCLSHCFGTTTTDPSTEGLTQLVLSQLGSLLPPSSSSPVQVVPGANQSVVNQTSCQTQLGGTDITQVQSATQTNATVQIVLNSAPSSVPAPADQTQQQTWQLQIGCLFYCVDSQQVQQAQQSTTTIQVVAGPPGSASVQQTVWQVQIGCLAWCWNSTQVQQASSQSTITVLTTPPTDGGQPPVAQPQPAPGPAPPPDPQPAASTASAPAVATPPAAVSASAAPAAASITVLESPRRTGRALLTSWSVTTVPVPADPIAPARLYVPADRSPAPRIAALGAVRPSLARPRHVFHSSPAPVSVPVPAIVVAPTLRAERDGGGNGLIVALMLTVAGAVSLALIRRRRAQR
jgi:hypothetical protein